MNEIEKQFLKIFGIEPKLVITKDAWERYKILPRGEEFFKQYPPITDRILLELICILNKHYSEHYQIASMIVGKNIEEVKKSILNDCIEQSKHKDFKQQIQALFKEDN